MVRLIKINLDIMSYDGVRGGQKVRQLLVHAIVFNEIVDGVDTINIVAFMMLSDNKFQLEKM